MTSIEEIERLLRYGMCPAHRIAPGAESCATCAKSIDAIETVRALATIDPRDIAFVKDSGAKLRARIAELEEALRRRGVVLGVATDDVVDGGLVSLAGFWPYAGALSREVRKNIEETQRRSRFGPVGAVTHVGGPLVFGVDLAREPKPKAKRIRAAKRKAR